jgi:hypothetical protein
MPADGAPRSECVAVGGSYQGNDMDCTGTTCPVFCPADIDGNGAVDAIDFPALLAAWDKQREKAKAATG